MRDTSRPAFRCRRQAATLLMAASIGMVTALAGADDMPRTDDSSRDQDQWQQGNSRERPDRHGNERRFDRDDHHHDRGQRDRRGYGMQPEPRVEVIVDDLSTREPARREARVDEDRGATICRQAHSVTWSTRNLPCPDPQPAERSNVWSTTDK